MAPAAAPATGNGRTNGTSSGNGGSSGSSSSGSGSSSGSSGSSGSGGSSGSSSVGSAEAGVLWWYWRRGDGSEERDAGRHAGRRGPHDAGHQQGVPRRE